MSIRENVILSAADVLKRMHPEWKRSDIEDALDHIWKQQVQDPTIIMDNNVKEVTEAITLTKLCNWIEREKPVISGNATFYCQPTVLRSPTSIMLRTMKGERKEVKSKLGLYKPSDDEYQMLDLTQQNIKVVMNAEYGGSGTPTAAFYTKWSPAATTLMAQSIITTMAAFFEGYLGDNQVFFNITECIDWMSIVCKKAEDNDIPKWIVIPNPMEVAERIKKKFINGSISIYDIEVINRFINHCNEKELVFLYYANNYRDLISRHPKMQRLLHNVLSNLPNYTIAHDEVPAGFGDKFDINDPSSVDKYNKWIANEMFLNPYAIPAVVKDDMKEFISLMTKFIYVEYVTPDSIIKLNNHGRNTVLLVDTDSNIINTDLFVSFVLNELFPNESFGREKIYNDMILVNVMCAALSESVALLLDYYGRIHNMDADSRKEFTMKNEFMFRVLFLMPVKKRYTASIVLREGNIIIPFKPEIKGVDFIKAGVSDDVEARFKKMLCDHILFSDTLEIHELVRDVKQFEREIMMDLKSGGMTYLKHMQFKDISAYKNPWTQQAFKATMAWNAIYDENKIYPLDRISLLKTKIASLNDLEDLKQHNPDIYDKIIQNIYLNPADPEMKNVGLKLIAIPNTESGIPEWLIPYIDYDLIISDMIGSFKSILSALGLPEIQFKTPNGKASITSGIISL